MSDAPEFLELGLRLLLLYQGPDQRALELSTEAQQYYGEMVSRVLVALPWKEIILGGVFAWCWKEGGKDKSWRVNDIILGLIGGFTLPSALQGGWISGGWAAGYLTAIGINFADGDSIASWCKDVQVPGPKQWAEKVPEAPHAEDVPPIIPPRKPYEPL